MKNLYSSFKVNKIGRGKSDGWSFEDTVKLIVLFENHTYEQCAEILGKTRYGCQNRRQRLVENKQIVDQQTLIKFLLQYYRKTEQDLEKVIEEIE